MSSSYQFTVDVFRTICERLQAKAVELRMLVETAASFEDWLIWEAFLACKRQQASYSLCEVAAQPTYASEGVVEENDPERNLGDLRVGGPNDGSDHCWLFAEFVLVHDGNRKSGEWLRKIESKADKLKRLGWKKSASLMIVVAASRGDVLKEWTDDLAGCAVWHQPPLTDPFVITLPGAVTVILKALEIKQDPANRLTATGR